MILNERTGYFIAFEGIDGSGKSCQGRSLAKTLKDRGFDVVLTREPTDGHWGQKIRHMARAGRFTSAQEELDLFIKDRREHIETLILPGLLSGKIIIIDRYYFSSAAYQGSRGLDVPEILDIHEFAPVPDLLIIMDLEPSIAMSRILRGRRNAPDQFEAMEQLEKCRAIYNNLEFKNKLTIDASRNAEEIEKEILYHVERSLLARIPGIPQELQD